jgi:hypothetical protein
VGTVALIPASRNVVLCLYPGQTAYLHSQQPGPQITLLEAAGDPGDPRAHLHHPDLPVPAAELRLGRVAAIWSAVSVGVLLLGVVVLAIFFPRTLIPGALLLLGVYLFIDASFHRSLESLIRSVVVALALLATIILVVQFFVLLLLVLVVFVGILILVENVRELIA